MSTASACYQDKAGVQVQGQQSLKLAQFRSEKTSETTMHFSILEDGNETLKTPKWQS